MVDQPTSWDSLTVLLPVLMLVYAVIAARARGSFRDMLAIALCLGFSSALFVILGIGIDDFGGVDTYYTVGEAGPSYAGPWRGGSSLHPAAVGHRFAGCTDHPSLCWQDSL